MDCVVYTLWSSSETLPNRAPSKEQRKPAMSDLIRSRAEVKARARERDEERLRRGEISAAQLQRENCVFRGFRKDVIGFGPKHRPKSGRYILIDPDE